MSKPKKGQPPFRTTAEDRMLAALRVEVGASVEALAVEYNVRAECIEHWVEHYWRARHDWRGEPGDVINEVERAAGYELEDVDEDRTPYQPTTVIVRGPTWTAARVVDAIAEYAHHSFPGWLAEAARDRNVSTAARVERGYRMLNDESRGVYAPAWDLFQIALDDIKEAHVKMQRAAEIAAAELPAESLAAA